MGTEKPLSCTIKPLQHIRVGEHKVEFHSGCATIDVTFPNVYYVEIQEIHLKNYYTAAVSMLLKVKAPTSAHGSGEIKWMRCFHKMTLMPHPHTDSGAEDYFTIGLKQLGTPLHNVMAVRFILYQPSPAWKEFYIEDIKFYKQPPQNVSETVLPNWLTDTAGSNDEAGIDKELKGISSVNELSKDMQSLWALTSHMAENQTKSSLGRYDVDGSYEINLLSYT